MQKSVGIVIGIIIVVLLLAVFWMFRGRPAGEAQPAATGSPRAQSRGSVGSSPVASPATPQAAASPVAPPVEAPALVSIAATGFSPASITVPVGGAVSFTNNDTQSHQVASAPHPVHTNYPPLNGAVLAAGETQTVTFTQAGSFNYHDHLNPGLTGVVVVQ